MKLTPEEKAARKEAFRTMTLFGKLEYIFSYYKLPLVLILIGVIIAVSLITRWATKKNELLYLGFANVSVREDLQVLLTEDFVSALEKNPRKNEVYLYSDLYVSDNPPAEYHEYSYASKLKILAAINARQLDVVLLNRESYDIFSNSGYLLDLSEFLEQEAPELLPAAEPFLTENDIILEDNSIEMELKTADEYQSVTDTSVNALEVTNVPLLVPAGFPDPVYLGVIANTPRTSEVLSYIQYVIS